MLRIIILSILIQAYDIKFGKKRVKGINKEESQVGGENYFTWLNNYMDSSLK